MNTGACTSEVTFIDGEKGILRHRGVSIEDVCENSSFIETSYMLMRNKWPKEDELLKFRDRIRGYKTLPAGITQMIKTFPKDAHPMGILSSCMVALSAYYPELCDQDLTDDQKETAAAVLMGQLNTVAAAIYRHCEGKDAVASNPELTFCGDFLNMMFDKGGDVDSDITDALDVLLMLHADHEQNCSASSVRLVGSSKANLFATISAGVDALWGPLHGGANQAVIEMLDAIQADGGGYKKFLDKAKDKEDPFRLMGFGHRVYKNFDPRAKIIKGKCDTVLSKLGVDDPVLEIAKGLEEAALSDPYFAERKLFPNVDFYSGIIYRALGIPTNMFTVMFAIGRLPGWIAQWKEMIEAGDMKIGRPRQIYTGSASKPYPSMSER